MNWLSEQLAFHPALLVSAAGVIIAVIGTIAERRRAKRKDINKVGFMPWRFIVFASMFTALISGVLALKS